MGLKDALKKGIDNVSDTIDEASHRGAARTEHATRDLAGDEMTVGEKAKSMVNEAGHTVAAEIDHTKRDVRNNT